MGCGGSSGIKTIDNSNFKQEEYYYNNVNLTSDFGIDFGPKEKIQLNLSIKNPENGQKYSVSVNISSQKDSEDSKFLGKTKEIISSSDSIYFDLSFILDYFFERQQYLSFTIDKNGFKMNCETTIGRIMGSRGQIIALAFSEGPERLCLKANSLKNNNKIVCISLSIRNDKNVSLFYLIKKKRQLEIMDQLQTKYENQFWNIYKSENKLVGISDVPFNPIKIHALFLCNGDFDHPISIEFHNPTQKSVIGIYNTTIANLLINKSFMVQNLNINYNCDIINEHTFIDYLRGGMQLSLSIGIDFTGSNGNAKKPDSLHNMDNRGKPNPYQLAIRSCGDILAYYDYDQLFPVYGYGANLNNLHEVSHCFPLTLKDDPNCLMIDGVLDTYRKILPTLTFSGPTYFSPLINKVINNIIAQANPKVYYILLILTDGMINDMEKTIEALVNASQIPLSVIIVGVGYGDFGNMDILDSDGKFLVDYKGRKSTRDLVQFVPFHKFSNNGQSLAEEVLAELPKQVVEYYKLIKQPPGDPIINI